jgi:hypothetical protein
VPGSFLAAEPAGDFLLGFRGTRVSFGLVGCGRDPQVSGEPQDVVATVAESFQQCPVLELAAAFPAGQLAEAESRVLEDQADVPPSGRDAGEVGSSEADLPGELGDGVSGLAGAIRIGQMPVAAVASREMAAAAMSAAVSQPRMLAVLPLT